MPRARTVLTSVAYVALSVADSVAAGRSRRSEPARRSRYVLKPALMPVLTCAFLDATRDATRDAGRDATRDAGRDASGGHDTRVLRAGTAVAQAFSWGGDVALLGRSERAFLTGVASFFAAHVSYVAAFGSVLGHRDDRDPARLRLPLGLWLVAAPLMSAAAGRRDPRLRAPVAAYATILSAMFATSRMLDPALPRRPRRTVQAGTALFLLSDSVLAVQEFVLTERQPLLESVVMATYTAGQGLIAAGVAAAT